MSMANRIRERVVEALAPTHMELVDETHQHNVPEGAESHFNLFVVSGTFDGLRQVQRHQTVYRALSAEMSDGIHALALKTLTPTEWADEDGGPAESPPCLGGSAVDPQST